MPIYWLSFRVEENPGAGARRTALIDAAKQHCSDEKQRWWDETTSFIVFESGSDIDAICADLKAAIDPTKDLFLIRHMNSASARICGKVKEFNKLANMMMTDKNQTYLKRVP